MRYFQPTCQRIARVLAVQQKYAVETAIKRVTERYLFDIVFTNIGTVQGNSAGSRIIESQQKRAYVSIVQLVDTDG